MQLGRIAPAFQSNRNPTRIDPDGTGKKSAENARAAILTATITIELNCGQIAKPRRIASKSWQIHKLQSNVPDCPTVGIRPRSVRSQNAIPQNTGNAGTIFCNPGDPGGTGSRALCDPSTILRIVDRLQIQCNTDTIQTDWFRIATNCHPSAQDCPKLDRGTIDPKCQDGNPDRNLHNRI